MSDVTFFMTTRDKNILIDILRQSTSNNPRSAWTIAYKRAIEIAINAIENERPNGYWIHDGSHWENRWICSECNCKLFDVKRNYCPECGAKMEREDVH